MTYFCNAIVAIYGFVYYPGVRESTPPPLPPRDVEAVMVNRTSILLQWTEPHFNAAAGRVTSYVVRYNPEFEEPWQEPENSALVKQLSTLVSSSFVLLWPRYHEGEL